MGVEAMFKRAIADALGVTIEHVVKLTVTEIGQGSGLRRLQAMQTKRYEVSYEISLPSSMDPADAVKKANRISLQSSAESQAFRQVLTTTDGVAQVHHILPVIPAHTMQEVQTTVTLRTPP